MEKNFLSKRRLVLLGALCVAGALVVFVLPTAWQALRIVNAIAAEADRAVELGVDARDLAQACASCHGLESENISYLYPSLSGQPATYIEAQLDAFANGGRRNPFMEPLAFALSEDQRVMIADYYSKLPPAASREGLVEQGALDDLADTLVTSCKGCHGDSFAGRESEGDTPASPRLAGLGAGYLQKQMLDFKAGRRKDPSGAMNAQAVSLSISEIERIARYLSQ